MLNGCVEREIIDELSLVEGIGFDYSEDGNIIGTTSLSVFIEDQPPENISVTAESTMKKAILQKIEQKTSNPIAIGSLQLLVFGQELAVKEGILDLLDPFQRDPAVGSTLDIAIVDGEAKKLLGTKYGKTTGTATFISELLTHNWEEGDLPKTNFHRFLSNFFQKGKTPFIPIIKQVSAHEVELVGLGFFRYGKMIERISMEDSFFFKLMVDEYSNGVHNIEVDGQAASIQSIYSSHNYRLTNRSPYEVTIDIKVNGIINEFTGKNTIKDKTFDKLEDKFEEVITHQCQKLVAKFQEKEIDPIGFGHFVKTRTRNFDFKKWDEKDKKNLVVKINATVDIQEGGVIE